MSRKPINRDPFEADSDPLLKERAELWLGAPGRHLSESELTRLAELAGRPLQHILECEECAMRLSTQLATGAARGELRAASTRSRRWALAGAAVAALLILAFLPPILREPAPGRGPAPAIASLLHDPSAVRSPNGGSEIVLSRLEGGALNVLLGVETSSEQLLWEVEPPAGEPISGTLAFPPSSAVYKDFVLQLRLRELLPQGSGELMLRAHDPEGLSLGQWLLRIRP